MKEELLHYLWQTKRLLTSNLMTTDGEAITILNHGVHNHDAGPDFLHAKVQIGTTEWNGHIEIHIKSSDWNAHKHQNDLAYNNVILHVVHDYDKSITNNNGQVIPTLEIKDKYDAKLLDRYESLLASSSWIPCEEHIATATVPKLGFFLERKLTDRLMRKHLAMAALLEEKKQDWEEVLYTSLLKYIGLKVNNTAFLTLASIAPYRLLIKQGESVKQKESLLFGQAGLFGDEDDYFVSLRKEYQHQKAKYELQPMTGVEWKFSRLRPPNFPSLRIAQIATLYHQSPKLFNLVIRNPDYKYLSELLEVTASEYWNEHYVPGKISESKAKAIGKMTKDILIINVFTPLIFTYGIATDDEKIKSKAIDLLYEVKAENNSIIRKWKERQIKPENAGHSQALLEIKTQMCDKFRCLQCTIGQQILHS